MVVPACYGFDSRHLRLHGSAADGGGPDAALGQWAGELPLAVARGSPCQILRCRPGSAFRRTAAREPAAPQPPTVWRLRTGG
jgi:hypothetical protein